MKSTLKSNTLFTKQKQSKAIYIDKKTNALKFYNYKGLFIFMVGYVF